MWIRLLGVGDAYVAPQVLSYLRIHEKQESEIHQTDFRLIKEQLIFAIMAFQLPHVYGDYTRSEKRLINWKLMKRLVREGLGTRGLKPKLEMVKIGISDLTSSRLLFCFALLLNLPRLLGMKRRKK